uniref:Transcription initiation factor TFIID subunit 7 n=1 Tax=Tetraselmis sp. GSL018 TaxID=582737 RepID=A0A061S106_9CHLO|mmetsp:Transcript_34264/g.81270  ORF Transcript_34264/g.81270 Transcript_34264/m.81270 type:complete len:227 (-) Transcript_34264:57-737(-)
MASTLKINSEGREEQFLFRCLDVSLADKIRNVLKSEPGTGAGNTRWQLRWFSEREGVFEVDGEEYPCQLLDLPGVVESYKTYDDVHLVKCGDVGQVVLVRRPESEPVQGIESPDGLTPAMKDARRRHFRPRNDSMDPFVVEQVESDLNSILSMTPISGVEIRDVEEVWVEDENGNGSWQAVEPSASSKPGKAAPRSRGGLSGRRGSGKRAAQRKERKQDGVEVEEI